MVKIIITTKDNNLVYTYNKATLVKYAKKSIHLVMDTLHLTKQDQERSAEHEQTLMCTHRSRTI